MGRSDYETRKADRIARLAEKASTLEKESDATSAQAHNMASVIPFGQPILVGHHSEKSDRSYRNRIGKKMDAAVELHKKAEHYKQKALAAEGNEAINSDNPDAIELLLEKTAELERRQDIMKKANRIIRKAPKNESTPAKIEALLSLGLQEMTAVKLFEPDFVGRIGFAAYMLQNNNASIKRTKARITVLKKAESVEYKEIEKDGYKVIVNPDLNRIQIDFHSKKDYERLCKERGISLRSYGFVFSRNDGDVWQRKITSNATYATQRLMADIEKV